MTPEQRRYVVSEFHHWCNRQALRIRHQLAPHVKHPYSTQADLKQHGHLVNQGVAFHYQGVKRHGAS